MRRDVELRAHVLRLAAQAGLTPERAQTFAVAVNEAVSNAIEHAGGCGDLALVQVDKRRLIARSATPARGYRARPRRPCRHRRRWRGRGMWLAGKLADRMKVRSDHSGTMVRLKMHLRTP